MEDKDILNEAVKRNEQLGYTPKSGKTVVEWYNNEDANVYMIDTLHLIGSLIDMVQEAREANG